MPSINIEVDEFLSECSYSDKESIKEYLKEEGYIDDGVETNSGNTFDQQEIGKQLRVIASQAFRLQPRKKRLLLVSQKD